MLTLHGACVTDANPAVITASYTTANLCFCLLFVVYKIYYSNEWLQDT